MTDPALLSGLFVASTVALISVPVANQAQTPARNGNQSDFKDWQPARGAVAEEERAAEGRETPAERKSEDRELQDLYKNLLRHDAPSSPEQPVTAR